MKLKYAVFLFTILILGLFAALSLTLVRTTYLFETESHELANAAESIRIAQGLKIRLLAYNRDSFLYQLMQKPAHHENSRSLRQEINDLLQTAEKFVNNEEEQITLDALKQEVQEYLSKRDDLEQKPFSSLKKYTLISQDVDETIAAVDKLVAINWNQMNALSELVVYQNKRASFISVLLFSLGGLLLFAIILGIMSFISQPLSAVAKTISRYTSSDPNVRTKPGGINEVREIALNFNTMADRLEERRQDQLRFIAAIAHDLRNPLGSILMACELLKEQAQEKDLELSKIMLRQLKNLDRLIGDLLDTTRIEAGQLELKLAKNDVSMLIKDSVEIFRTSSKLHGFTIELPNQPLACSCDGGRISQVMNNLLSNAIKYSPNGGAVKVVGWQKDGLTHIAVSDEGIGIEAQDIENIFKPFHRTKATKASIRGIGLGLSASRRIIEGHGGKLVARSVSGKGSTFQISLPS